MTANAMPARSSERRIIRVFSATSDHWVGDGFLVRTVFDPTQGAEQLSPFILLDHAARRYFEPSNHQRGVGEHPHRGFETVTLAYAGEVEHRDSSGGGGRIGPGDVQWMTAARGLVHEEMHSAELTERGGEFEMVQLWVNLPARKKMMAPGYQTLRDQDLPRLEIGSATARLIAGHYAERAGPAQTQTPMTVLDLRFERDGDMELSLPAEWTTVVVGLEGELRAGSAGVPVPFGSAGLFEREQGGTVGLNGDSGTRVLVLSGQPIGEPVVARGPFVMNTKEEILEAFQDYQSGQMGRLP